VASQSLSVKSSFIKIASKIRQKLTRIVGLLHVVEVAVKFVSIMLTHLMPATQHLVGGLAQ